jgi:hypothetical protein
MDLKDIIMFNRRSLVAVATFAVLATTALSSTAAFAHGRGHGGGHGGHSFGHGHGYGHSHGYGRGYGYGHRYGYGYGHRFDYGYGRGYWGSHWRFYRDWAPPVVSDDDDDGPPPVRSADTGTPDCGCPAPASPPQDLPRHQFRRGAGS